MNKYLVVLILILFSGISEANPSGIEKEFQLLAQKLKGKAFFQYNKLLKEKPNASGLVLLKISIGNDGKINSCKTFKSELHAPDFEKKLCNILKSRSYQTLSKKPATFHYGLEFMKL